MKNKIGVNKFEICAKCGYRIPLSEQAFVFQRNIVCMECDNVLRTKNKTKKMLPNKNNKTRDKLHTNGGSQMNLDTFINNNDKKKDRSQTRHIHKNPENISKFNIDETQLMENKTKKRNNNSDNLLISKMTSNHNKELKNSDEPQSKSNSQDKHQNVTIKLPSFIHSCFMENNLTSQELENNKSHRYVGNVALLLSIAAIVVIGVALITRYLL